MASSVIQIREFAPAKKAGKATIVTYPTVQGSLTAMDLVPATVRKTRLNASVMLATWAKPAKASVSMVTPFPTRMALNGDAYVIAVTLAKVVKGHVRAREHAL